MGNKTTVKYQMDNDQICTVSLDNATLAVANNPEPAGGVTTDLKAKVSKNNREHGLRPRMAILTREISAAGPDGIVSKNLYARVVILTKTAFDAAAFAKRAEVVYDGHTWRVHDRLREDY